MFTSNINVSTSSRMSRSLSTSPPFDTSRRRSKRQKSQTFFFSVQVDLNLFNCYKIRDKIEFDIDLYIWHKTVVFLLDELMLVNILSVVTWSCLCCFPSIFLLRMNELYPMLSANVIILFFYFRTCIMVKTFSLTSSVKPCNTPRTLR